MENIDNKIYDVLQSDVEKRQKGILVPLVCLAIGVAVSCLAFVVADANLHFGLIVCGSIIALVALGFVLSRKLSDKCDAYYVPGQETFRRIESFYAYESLAELQACVTKGDYNALRRIRTVDSSNVMLVSYDAFKSGVHVCQIWTYVPHEYRPVSESVVMRERR